MSIIDNEFQATKSIWKHVLPIPVLLIVLTVVLWLLLPKFIQENTRENAISVAVSTVSHFKKIREYYTLNVISKVINNGSLRASYNHKSEPDAIPLPATFIHDMSLLLEEENTRLNLFSPYPFPNRISRKMDEFQLAAWDFLAENPDSIFVKETFVDEQHIIRVALADKMLDQECVNCHNSRKDSPKTNWKLNDIRGVLEVTIDTETLDSQSGALEKSLSYSLATASLLILGVLGIHIRSIISESKYINNIVNKRTKQLQLATQESYDKSARISTILDTVVDGIITINHKGIIKSFNPAAERIFGFTAEETLNKNIKILMPEPFHSKHDGYLHNYLTTGDAQIIGIGREVIGKRKDGSTFPMELAVSEFTLSNNKMFTGIVRDITERKQAELMKKEFISTVSHELRTPLTSIKGSLRIIESDAICPVPEKIRPLLDIANKNCENLIVLINDILDMEKLASGKMLFNMQKVDLIELIKLAIDKNIGYSKLYDVNFNFSTSIETAFVIGDQTRLEQVLANLMSNAAKFSDKGQSVHIDISEINDSYRVSITDYGIGIPEDFKDRIFGKFQQADGSNTRQKGGTGLGLSISHEIISQHNGKIDFESTPGESTTFYFDLHKAV